MKSFAKLAILFSVGGLFVSHADASTITFATGGNAGAYAGTSSDVVTIDGVNVTFSTNVGTFTENGASGLGIASDGFEDDEISGPEVLTISFSQVVKITTAELRKLFFDNATIPGLTSPFLEQGSYAIDGGSPVAFQADPTQFQGSTLGALTLNIALSGSSIQFTAPSFSFETFESHEYSLRSLSFEKAVPEPASLLLLLSGAVGVVRGRRKLS